MTARGNGMDGLLLAGDVGGTKTILAALPAGGEAHAPVVEATYESRAHASLEAIVRDFVDRHGLRLRGASFAVAGPVAEGRAELTNLGWELDRERLRDAFGLESVHLVNDLQATAYAIPRLPAERLLTLQPGRPDPYGVRAVIAPGTGLGEGFLTWDGTQFEAWPSEGGNADFAPADETQVELLLYMRRRVGHVRVEHVCSGIGLPNVYQFLRDTGAGDEPAWLVERLAAVDDPTPVIATAALADPGSPEHSALCARAMGLFVDVLGSEAGSMALRLLARGGVYVGGGIPPRILPLLRDGRFLAAFRAKGVFTELMETFPVYVVLEPRTALLGAAAYALSHPATHADMLLPRGRG